MAEQPNQNGQQPRQVAAMELENWQAINAVLAYTARTIAAVQEAISELQEHMRKIGILNVNPPPVPPETAQ